jgi:hypothetical protein
MSKLILLPFLIQSILMFIDEFYFHHKRGLPKWERIGHPIDTLFLLLPFFIFNFLPFTKLTSIAAGILILISSLIIIKDEWVHKEHSSGGENALHALLFMIHPLVLISSFAIWRFPWILKKAFVSAETYLQFAMISIGIFLIYQIIYWNIIYAKRNQ